jgi:hypothetical protein
MVPSKYRSTRDQWQMNSLRQRYNHSLDIGLKDSPGEDVADDRHTGVGDEAVHMEWMLARQWKKWASGLFWL